MSSVSQLVNRQVEKRRGLKPKSIPLLGRIESDLSFQMLDTDPERRTRHLERKVFPVESLSDIYVHGAVVLIMKGYCGVTDYVSPVIRELNIVDIQEHLDAALKHVDDDHSVYLEDIREVYDLQDEMLDSIPEVEAGTRVFILETGS